MGRKRLTETLKLGQNAQGCQVSWLIVFMYV